VSRIARPVWQAQRKLPQVAAGAKSTRAVVDGFFVLSPSGVAPPLPHHCQKEIVAGLDMGLHGGGNMAETLRELEI